MPHLFLHIGFAKTGTSSIQQHLESKSDFWEKCGIFSLNKHFKKTGSFTFHDLAVSFIEKRSPWDSRLLRLKEILDFNTIDSHNTVFCIKSRIKSNSSNICENVLNQEKDYYIASSEFLCAFNSSEAEDFLEFMYTFFDSVSVIAYIQDLYDVMQSHCSWSIINRGQRLHHFFKDNTLDFFNYPQVFKRWTHTDCGIDVDIQVVNFSELKRNKGNSVDQILKAIAKSKIPDLDSIAVPKIKSFSNQTPNHQSVEFLSLIKDSTITNKQFNEIRMLLLKKYGRYPKWSLDTEIWDAFKDEAATITNSTNSMPWMEGVAPLLLP